jgi:hypothetical protein
MIRSTSAAFMTVAQGIPAMAIMVSPAGAIEQTGNHAARGVHARLETHGMKMPAHQLTGVWKRDLTEPFIHVLPAFFIERFH